MLRDNLVGLIEPMPTARENDGSSLALSIHKQRQASDDRSSCLKNPRPAGAESSLTERTTSPFQTEPRHKHELAIDDPQVVNGLQTSQKIFDNFTSRPELAKTDKRELLIRVIQVNDSKTQDDIIEATNSQTKVAPSSFWATKTIHRDIETVFQNENLFY